MSTRTDLTNELIHCRKMVASTHDAIEHRIRELSNVETPIDGEKELVDALERQHKLWRQLANEIEAYLLKHEPADQDEVLFA
jgi:hypothetical protein